ncbi:MAG: cyclopropane-fatty-acyl-phospholipid synthase family protein [Cellvibrionaceae bacterium]|nr:cyclopropane-fatty-acyl-phospholipid synthase family protein [Cellvibrionaceae bacterium]
MKSVSVVDKNKQKILAENTLDSLARRLVLTMLNKIRVGHLSVEEGGQVYSFGEPQETTEMVAHIYVGHPSFYRYVLANGTIGAGEAYMLKAWWSPDLVQVVRLMALNMPLIQMLDSRWSFAKNIVNRIAHRLRVNNKKGSKRNIAAHYDLGNCFFELFLDPTMLYSSAIFTTPESTLEQASLNKQRHICERLRLRKTDYVLEIGTGWGGMAIYAAKHYGCHVTSVTISKEQYEYAVDWVRREALQDRVEIRLQDYRDISGQFDKLVSIEMIEAVGHQYYASYFAKCSALLKPNGKMLIQAITIADQRYEREKDNVDFIQRYIFPGGCLPSVAVIADAVARHTDLQIVGLEDITAHYARTLAEWRRRFFLRIDEVRQQGFDDVFIRMWDFYLSYCEGGFRERVIGTSQILFAKPNCRDLLAVR